MTQSRCIKPSKIYESIECNVAERITLPETKNFLFEFPRWKHTACLWWTNAFTIFDVMSIDRCVKCWCTSVVKSCLYKYSCYTLQNLSEFILLKRSANWIRDEKFLFKNSSKSVKRSINSNKLFIDWMSSYHSFPHSLESHERNDFLIFRKSFVPDTLNCQISEVLMKLTISFLWPRNREINTIWCCLGNMIQSIIVH